MTELYEYFKNINSSDEEYDINNYNIQFGLEISNRMLNCSITDTEIENVVRNLPNNKAVGTDCIRNEYLKSTLYLLLPSYVKIFNIIFDTGIKMATGLEVRKYRLIYIMKVCNENYHKIL